MPSDGVITLNFSHRWSGEGGGWDGGLVVVSVDGADWQRVESFTAGGYNGNITGDTVLGNALRGPAFVDQSAGYDLPEYINSEAEITATAGQVIVLGFLYSWDQGCSGLDPNWEITKVSVKVNGDAIVFTPAPMVSFEVIGNGQMSGTSGLGTGYQWQRDDGAGFVDIPGATENTYTLTGVTLTDSGAKFRCVGTLPILGPSGTSAEATLTVIAGCGAMVVTKTAEGNVDITWGSACTLQGTDVLVPLPGETPWVTINAGDPGVVLLEPGHAILTPTAYKFFHAVAPTSCP
jgi:hypothetical protein